MKKRINQKQGKNITEPKKAKQEPSGSSSSTTTTITTTRNKSLPPPDQPFTTTTGHVIPPMNAACKRTCKDYDVTADNVGHYLNWLAAVKDLGILGKGVSNNIADLITSDKTKMANDKEFRKKVAGKVKNLHTRTFVMTDEIRIHNNEVQQVYRNKLKTYGICRDCIQPIEDDPEFEYENYSCSRCFNCLLLKRNISKERYRKVRVGQLPNA